MKKGPVLRRVSVRDLADKFEKGFADAESVAKSDESKLRELVALERHVLLEKLNSALGSLQARVTDRTKDDVDEAISMVADLSVKLTQSEGEFSQEKEHVKILADFLKQIAKAAVQKVEEAFQEQQRIPITSDNLGSEDLMKEVQDARRIKMLHQHSKVLEMELELQELRIQLAEMSTYSNQLLKELTMRKGLEENKCYLYELDGPEILGSYLCITPRTETAPHLSECSVQWYRICSKDKEKKKLFQVANMFYLSQPCFTSGATKLVYAPEPFDVGQILLADIVVNGERLSVETNGPIGPAPGLGSYIEELVRISETEFNVVVIQMNEEIYSVHSVHVFHVGKMRVKLSEGRFVKAKESYSTSMQLCGTRGGGNAAALSLFWQAKEGLSFVLAFNRQRKKCSYYACQRFAFDWSIALLGPGDCTIWNG
ncbi:hypothetical protein MKW92_010427 [Papaver armeniacum]|nr:hypothetical protein MKW92_010427 [Papaver armeniacum]